MGENTGSMRASQEQYEAILARRKAKKETLAQEQHNAMIRMNREALAKGPVKARKAGKPLRIGVDPALRVGGLGVCTINEFGEVDFPRFPGRGIVAFVKWLDTVPKNSVAVVENSNLTNATFDNSGNSSVRARKSRNVGMNQGVSVILIEFLKDRLGEGNVKDISPLKKGSKWNAERMDSEMKMRKNTRTKKKTNQDERDAYQIATK